MLTYGVKATKVSKKTRGRFESSGPTQSKRGKGMKSIGEIVSILIAAVILVILTGLAVGAANAWILQGTFWDGWHAALDRPLIALGWAILFGGGAGALASRNY